MHVTAAEDVLAYAILSLLLFDLIDESESFEVDGVSYPDF